MSLQPHVCMILFLILPFSVNSQTIVLGRVVNSKKENIENAEVIITNTETFLQQFELTSSNGSFSFTVEQGKYTLEIKIYGELKSVQSLTIVSNTTLEDIVIDDTTVLNEVVIVKEKKLLEKKIDRLVFNVENSVALVGGDAIDALKSAPRIKFKNNELVMIGKGNVKLMVDDRIIPLAGDDLVSYLKTINADDIKKIEIISNPPAKYNAEGNSGIIHIITKKTTDVWNLSYRGILQQATYATGSNGLVFNLSRGKIKLNSGITYTNGSTAPTESNLIYYPDQKWEEYNKRRDYTNAFSARLGLDQYINEKISHGFLYTYVNSEPLIKERINSNIYNYTDNTADSIITTRSRNPRKREIHSANYHLIYKLSAETEKKLSFDIDYFKLYNQNDRRFYTTTNISENSTGARNYGKQEIENFSANVDMSQSIPGLDLNINYGGRVSSIQTENDFATFQTSGDIEIVNPDLSNKFNYKEKTQALYLSLYKEISDYFEVKAGLRMENTDITGESPTIAITNKYNYTKLFPTLYFLYSLNEDNALNLNYGRRISRPNYGLLNPFRYISSPYSYSEGNPYLQPSFNNNIELEYTYKDNLITNFYISWLNNGFEQVTDVDTESNIQKVIPLNVFSGKMIGINQIILFKLYKWCRFNFYADLYYSKTSSNTPITLPMLDGWNGEFNLTGDFILNERKTLFINIDYNYTTTGVDKVDTNTAFSQLDLSFKSLFLDRNLIVGLHLNDIFSSNRPTYTTMSNNLKTSYRNYYDERYIRLSVIYRLGKSFKSETHESKNSDEMNRTE